MKIQSNKSWYQAISNVNPIFYKSTSINNPLTTILPRIYHVRAYIGPRESTQTIMNDLTVKRTGVSRQGCSI